MVEGGILAVNALLLPLASLASTFQRGEERVRKYVFSPFLN